MANPILGGGVNSLFDPVAGSKAEAAAIQYLVELGKQLDVMGDGDYTLTRPAVMAMATNVINGRVPRSYFDNRWAEYTGKPTYSKGFLRFVDVTNKPWWRGRAGDYQEWLSLGELAPLLNEVQASSNTDLALPARLAQVALDNGNSTAPADVDFDGLAYWVTSPTKPFNPLVPSMGSYQTSFAGVLNDVNLRAAIDELYQRRDVNGEPLKLWNYGMELWHCLGLKTVADDLVKLADLIPKAGPGGGDTGGNTSTLVKYGITPMVLEHTDSTASSGKWYLQSLHPACKPLVQATPPDPLFPVFYARGQDPQAPNEIKAGFMKTLGVRMLTSLGSVQYTY